MPPLDLTALTAAVERDRTVNDSAITLLNSLAQQIRDNANDPAAITAIADQLDANQAALAAAVSANTPSAPTAPAPESGLRTEGKAKR